MNTNIKVLFYTFTETELQVLSLSQESMDFPTLNLNSLDLSKSIVGMQHVLKKNHINYTTISFEWATYKFLDIDLHQKLDNNVEVNIYYCVFLPTNAQIYNGFWTEITGFVHHYPILRKMISYV